MFKNALSDFQLTEAEKKAFTQEITAFFRDELETEIGIIATGKVLDFFLEDMGHLIYNKALDDARIWFKKNMENVEADYYSLYKSEGMNRR